MVRFVFLIFFSFVVFGAAARADDDPLAGLASGNYDGVAQAVTDLSQSGNPRAAAIITALQRSQLYYLPDKTVVIKAADGSYTNAATGEAVTVPPTDDDDPDSGPQQVRLNNNVRNAMDAAMGSLQLLDPDPHHAPVRRGRTSSRPIIRPPSPSSIRRSPRRQTLRSRRRWSRLALPPCCPRTQPPKTTNFRQLQRYAPVAIRIRAGFCKVLPTSPARSALPPPPRSPRSTMSCRSGASRKASIMASVSVPCCCSPPPA